MSAQEQNWDDLQLILAIARGKGLSGASRELGCHHATVLRRLNTLEQKSGVILFNRTHQGYEPTKNGEELARLAELIEQDVLTAFRKLAGNDLRLSGKIRCTTTDYIAETILPEILKSFRDTHPDIIIEIIISSHFTSLGNGDADVAIRPTNNTTEMHFGKCVSEIEFGIYGHKNYIKNQKNNSDIETYDWIGIDTSLNFISTNRWQFEAYPNSKCFLKYDSLLGRLSAVKRELGIAFLPHFVARKEKGLICIQERPEHWRLGLWFLTHPDHRHMFRIKAFLNCAEECLSSTNLNL